MPDQTMISLAVLSAYNSSGRRDYLNNFVPFVEECVKTHNATTFTSRDIANAVQGEFGLIIPEKTLDRLLRRLIRKKLVVRNSGGAFTRVSGKLAELTFDQDRANAARQHEALLRKLVQFSGAQNHLLDSEHADRALMAVLQKYGPIHSALVTIVESRTEDVRVSDEYIVAKFILQADKEDPEACEYLKTVTQGYVLASALYLNVPNPTSRRFQGTAVYFDTDFLMHALGYSGPEKQAPCRELLDMLRAAGAQLRCFDHTLREMAKSLDFCMHRLQDNDYDQVWGSVRDTLFTFVDQRMDWHDVFLIIDKLEATLKENNIVVVHPPDLDADHRFVIDQEGLTKVLQEQLCDQRDEARDNDVKSLVAVMWLRQERRANKVEDCGALFVTGNRKLAEVSANFLDALLRPDVVPPCLTDEALTTLVWLRSPQPPADLPLRKMIANCYAAMQPPDNVWQKCLAEIAKLERDGTATPEAAYALRSPRGRQILMDEILGDETAINRETMAQALDRTQSHFEGKAHLRAEEASRKVSDLQSKLDALEIANKQIEERARLLEEQSRLQLEREQEKDRQRRELKRKQLDSAESLARASATYAVLKTVIASFVLVFVALLVLALTDGGVFTILTAIEGGLGLLASFVVKTEALKNWIWQGPAFHRLYQRCLQRELGRAALSQYFSAE